MIDGQNVFGQPGKNHLRTYDNIKKIQVDQDDDYSTVCLLEYNYFKDYYKVIAMGLSKQQALETDPKAIQKINVTGKLLQGEDRNDSTTIVFIIEEAKEIILDFSQGSVKVL